MEALKSWIRDVPDFPKPGIVFKDITPLLHSPEGFRLCMDAFVEAHAGDSFDVIAGVESRGFLFGAPLALRMGKPFVPVRKPGKLPWKTERVEYALEYGTDALEVHVDAAEPGSRVLVIDDLLATGGTVGATIELFERIGAVVVGASFVVELAFLGGRDRIAPVPTQSLLIY
jgi:adenine phosphoribosyltransferase